MRKKRETHHQHLLQLPPHSLPEGDAEHSEDVRYLASFPYVGHQPALFQGDVPWRTACLPFAQLYAALNQQFTFPKDYLLSVYYAFYSGGDLGSVSIRPYQMLNLELQKDFFEKRFSVSLKAYDLLRTMKFREEQREGNLRFTQTEDYQLWNFSVSLVFRFNQLKNTYRGKNSSASDMERM